MAMIIGPISTNNKTVMLVVLIPIVVTPLEIETDANDLQNWKAWASNDKMYLMMMRMVIADKWR